MPLPQANPLEVAFFPCAHFCACNDCSKLIAGSPAPKCPICRTAVSASWLAGGVASFGDPPATCNVRGVAMGCEMEVLTALSLPK